MPFKRIAIMGAGSMGTILGAYLSKANKDVILIDAYSKHVEALNNKGATVVGKVQFNTPVRAVTPDKIEGEFDIFFYLTKQTANDVAIPQMISHCHKDAIICCMQNGIPEMEIIKHWPEKQICGAPIGWGATFLEPGISELTSAEGAAVFHMGSIDGTIYPWIYEVKELLECMCTAHLTTNLMAERWTKLTSNACLSGMSTVTGGTFGDVMCDDIGIQCIVKTGKEGYNVAKAAGYTLGTLTGVDYDNCFSYTDAAGQKACQEIFRDIKYRLIKDLVASMLQDLRKGQKCEIRHINGLLCETGDKYGVDTPMNDLIVKIVTEIEAGKRKYSMENLKEFLPLL